MLAGVNALTLDMRQAGGENRYLRMALAKMREVQPDTQFVVFTDPENHDAFEGWQRECIDTSAKLGIFGSIESQLDRAVRRSGVDLLFSSLWAAPSRLSVPLVLYAFDLRKFEEEYQRDNRRTAPNPKLAKRICTAAAAIVAPSEFIQRKFLELLEIPLNKIVVAPPGVDPAFGQPNNCAIQEPFLLTVGSTHAFRNIPRFRNAFDVLKDEIPHNLVVAGAPGEAEPADWGPRVIRIESCPTTYLAGLYQHCDVFVQPGIHEGSGITALEAMRAGAPVVTSRTGGVPEVAGDTPIYFNPESLSSIVASIRWAMEESPERRLSRVKYGRQVAAEYTWERCAWKTLSAFKRT
jgi:glycosyltransferase involved in cell wall biosynthesis